MSQYSTPDPSGEKERGRQRPNYVKEWSLRPWGYAFLFLLPITVFSAVLGWETFRAARAVHDLDSISIPDLTKSLQRDPGNADLAHRLGSTYSIDPSEANLPEAVKYLRQAVQSNPRRWDYWIDLGIVCDETGDTACSDPAFERAAAINPKTPSILWASGNHYLLTNRPEMSFPVFRRLLILDPNYLDSVLRLCFAATRDAQAIYTSVLPAGPDAFARFTFLKFLCAAADYETAMKIWAQMVAGPDPAPQVSVVKPFLDFLVDHNQIDDAEAVWSQLQSAGVILPGPPAGAANLLYNSRFETPPLNTGFDWNVSDSQDLEIDLADPSGHGGGKCLRAEFLVGRNADYDLVDQLILLKPDTRYRLSAWARSSNLTSDSGPRLRVAEVGCRDCPVRTSDATVGTTPWHSLEIEFLTQPQTRAARISFWRPRQQSQLRDITGTVWLDELKLEAVPERALARNQVRSR